MKTSSFTIILCIFFAGCSQLREAQNDTVTSYNSSFAYETNEERTWNLLSGKWYGKQKNDLGGYHEWISVKNPDGSFITYFKISDTEGIVSFSTDVGLWGIAGDMYFTIFQGNFEDGQFIPTVSFGHETREAYTILHLDSSTFHYQHESYSGVFKAKRVSQDFNFPE